tara:strand:- start:3863 stop:4291 length:429 start_codon:yes stop_codon:yes gene_type:complete
MKNNLAYKEQEQTEKKLAKKNELVDKTIETKKLSKYEIIHELLKALSISINELKTILFQELSVTREAKEKSVKISNIAFQLQGCLDLESSDLAKNLCWCYRYIRYMAKRVQDNDCMSYVKPASDVADTILEAWKTIPESERY